MFTRRALKTVKILPTLQLIPSDSLHYTPLQVIATHPARAIRDSPLPYYAEPGTNSTFTHPGCRRSNAL